MCAFPKGASTNAEQKQKDIQVWIVGLHKMCIPQDCQC